MASMELKIGAYCSKICRINQNQFILYAFVLSFNFQAMHDGIFKFSDHYLQTLYIGPIAKKFFFHQRC